MRTYLGAAAGLILVIVLIRVLAGPPIVITDLTHPAPTAPVTAPPRPTIVDEPSAPQPVVAKAPVERGPLVEVQVGARWFRAELRQTEESRSLVHVLTDPPSLEIWVPRENVRDVSRDDDVRDRHMFGEAFRSGRWRPVQILKVNEGRYFVHYLNESQSWDEWLWADRIRLTSPSQGQSP